jgi:hypothetical protein
MTTRQRQSLFYSASAIALLFSISAVAQSEGWFKAGSSPKDYDVGIDHGVALTGSASGYIRSTKPNAQGFGTYMQMFNATEYRGKRVRFSAYVQTQNVESWVGLWMRVDVERATAAFDNMQERPIKGTQGWTQHAVVLDVDSKATDIAFGVLLAGKGAAWIDDVSFEVVGNDEPVTDMKANSPRNLDFEDRPSPK